MFIFINRKNLLIHLVLVEMKMNKNLNIKMEISKINLCSLTGRAKH